MTVYELLKLNRKSLKVLQAVSKVIPNLKYVDMYREYNYLVKKRYKMMYIQEALCEKYGISKTTFYLVVKRMERELKP